MTLEEMQDQLDLLNKTNEELKASSAATLAEKTTLAAKVAKLEADIKTAIPKDYDELKKGVEPLKKENEQLKHQLAINSLAVKYPDVDLSLVQAGPIEQMDAYAAKLQAMVNKAKPPVDPKENKGDRWGKVPPAGGVDQDAQQVKEQEDRVRGKIKEGIKANDPLAVMNACMEGQPKATAVLFESIK